MSYSKITDKLKQQVQLLSRRLPANTIAVATVIVLAGLAGSYFLYSSQAATPTAVVEAESGTLTGNAAIVGDTTASGNSAVKFSSGSTLAYWAPTPGAEWQWVLSPTSGTFNTASVVDMGTGKTAYNSATSPATDPSIYDIDGILTPASTVTTLHSMGKKVVCYIEVGTQGNDNYYTAAQEGIATSYYNQLKNAGDLSTTTLQGYTDEYFVNINIASSATILEAEILQQCKGKGFDAVETDLDETWGNNEGTTPWAITQATEESFLQTLANYMHSNGLGWIAKNLDDTGTLSFVQHLEPYAQGMISEETNKFGGTAMWAPFNASNKWIGNAEYTKPDNMTLAKFCAADNTLPNVNGTLFNASSSLNGAQRDPCR